MNKIILERKKPKLTTIRISKSLLNDLKDAANETEYERISKQGLVDLAVRRFIFSLNNYPKAGVNHGGTAGGNPADNKPNGDPLPQRGADDAGGPITQEGF